MYHCYNPRRLGRLLLLDLCAILLWLLLSTLSRNMQTAAQEPVMLPVIMYHSITPAASTDYQLTPERFAEDLDYLEAHGYETVSVGQLVAYTRGLGDLPEKPVLLTFDDGFYNNLSLALPLLEAHDMCAVVHIIGRCTQEDAPLDPHVDRYSYLTWEDVRTLYASGRMELGSHTYDLHRIAGRRGCDIREGEDPAAYRKMLREDLMTMQALMQKETGHTPVIFAYPYGFISQESVPVLREMGFVCTFTCRAQWNRITQDPDCLYGLGRFNRDPALSSEDFFAQMDQSIPASSSSRNGVF